MKPYYAVIAANKGYQPGLSAFINSFRIHHKDTGIKIVVCDYDLEPEFINQHDGDDIEWIKVTSEKGHVWATKIERFRVACELGGVVAIFDGDMYCTASLFNYFKIAESGYVIGASNGSNNRYGKHWHQKFQMTDIPEIFDYKTVTSVPLIMDIEEHGKDVWGGLYEHKQRTGAGADFDLVNIFLMKTGRINDIIILPCEIATGVHHMQVKPETRAYWKGGKLMTMNGLEVLTVHGRFWEGNWYTNLMKPIPKHLARMGIHSSQSKAYQGALQSRELLKVEFDKYCDWPYKWSVKAATEANVQEQLDTFFVGPVKLEQQNQALVEKNFELAERIESLKREIKGYKHEIRVINQPQKETPLVPCDPAFDE